ncbi:MAG TPA: T9SS type A sorting domain-containing protein [Vicingaceae bacterium]|nr:T9SS type A sorting domain-containing protein [Vicingaceae bacterium]
MKNILFSTVLFTISILSFGQCPTTPIVLSSQADVDNFTTNYPSCTELQNSLTISGADITDLTPLSSIIIVGQDLEIVNNLVLPNLNGLNIDFPNSIYNGLYIDNNNVLNDISALSSIVNGFDSFDDVFIGNNPMLSNLNGLQTITYLYDLSIINNDSLNNLLGLDNFIASENIKINNNDNLSSLSGFGMVSSWSDFELIGNPILLNLDGLNPDITNPGPFDISNNDILNDISLITNWSLVYGGSYAVPFNISHNPNLSTCNILSICSLMDGCNAGTIDFCDVFFIDNNAEGCNSKAQVAQSCGLVPSNDECSSAIGIVVGETLEAYNDLATASPETPSCNDIDRADVWFTFNSGSNTTIDIVIDAGYNLQLWEGSCGSLTQVSGSCTSGSLVDFPVTTNTDYYVQVWSCTGCRVESSATGLFTILVQDGILSNNEVALATVELFPNPVKNSLTINASHEISKIEVYNLLGQRMLQNSTNTLETELDLAALKSGMYLVKVYSLGSEQTFKVLKE